METHKQAVSPTIFYAIVSFLTCLVFVTIATLAFIMTDLFPHDFAQILAVFFLLKSILIGAFSARLGQRAGKHIVLRVLGQYHGRMLSLLVGAAIGFQLGKLVWVIAGAVLFYMLGRWLGPIISFGIAGQVERMLPLPEENQAELNPQSQIRELFPPASYYFFLPVIILGVGLILKATGATLDDTEDYLPILRVIIIALSTLSVLAPWLLRRYLAANSHPGKQLTIDLMPLGLVLSSIPVIFGLFLFVSGATLYELIAFGIGSLASTSVWDQYMRRRNAKQPAG